MARDCVPTERSIVLSLTGAHVVHNGLGSGGTFSRDHCSINNNYDAQLRYTAAENEIF